MLATSVYCMHVISSKVSIPITTVCITCGKCVKKTKNPTSLPILLATELNMYSLFLTLSLKLYTSFAIGLQSMWLLKLLRAHFLLAAELSKRKGKLILTASIPSISHRQPASVLYRNATQGKPKPRNKFSSFVSFCALSGWLWLLITRLEIENKSANYCLIA